MEAIRVEKIVRDGQITVKDLPYEEGQVVEVILLARPQETVPRSRLTARQLRQSGIIGLWRDRTDIKDSATYARQLREQAQNRGDVSYDPAG